MSEFNFEEGTEHDGTICRLMVDFEKHNTELIIRDFIQRASPTKFYRLIFNEVVVQNFESMFTENQIFEIGTYKTYRGFEYNQIEYFERNRKLFPAEFFENMKNDVTLKYYYLMSVNNGMEGFIVCKSLSFETFYD